MTKIFFNENSLKKESRLSYGSDCLSAFYTSQGE